jgi:hypothetical protein
LLLGRDAGLAWVEDGEQLWNCFVIRVGFCCRGAVCIKRWGRLIWRWVVIFIVIVNVKDVCIAWAQGRHAIIIGEFGLVHPWLPRSVVLLDRVYFGCWWVLVHRWLSCFHLVKGAAELDLKRQPCWFDGFSPGALSLTSSRCARHGFAGELSMGEVDLAFFPSGDWLGVRWGE